MKTGTSLLLRFRPALGLLAGLALLGGAGMAPGAEAAALPAPAPAVLPDLAVTPDDPSLQAQPEAALSRRDLEVIAAAKKPRDYQPFSRKDLGFDLPRIPAIRVVRVTLDANPQVQSQEQDVKGRAGQVQEAEGAFDTHLTGQLRQNYQVNERNIIQRVIPGATPAPTPYPNPLRQRNVVMEYEAGVQKMLANGIVVNPRVSFSQNTHRDYAPIFSNDHRGTLGFAITIPLGKGGGTLSNKAPEIAARFDLTASVLQLRFITSQSIAATLRAYWECKAAEEIYQLRRESEQIADRLLGVATALVEGDEQAPAQLPQMIADRDSAAATRIQAEAALIAARQKLAVAMGFPPSALLLAPLTGDDFPVPPRKDRYPSPQTLIPTALGLRDDLRAARQTVKSKKVLMEASYLNLRPSVNLKLTGGYIPFETREQTVVTRGNNWEAGAEFSWDWPVENNSAMGAYIQSQAAFRGSEIAVEDTERTVVSQVITALADLNSSADNVRLYADAARWNREALQAQEELFALGQGTLTDTITARQRLVDAQVSAVMAKQNYANALVQLRFAVGVLFFSDERGSWIDQNVWNLVPFAGPDNP